MNSRPRIWRKTVLPGLLSWLFLVLITLACSETKLTGTQTSKLSANQTEEQAVDPQIPAATHVVYSPLVGSGATQASPATSLNVSISIKPKTLKIGEKVTITIQPGESEAPFYYLFLGDSDTEDVAYSVGVSTGNEVFPGENTSKILGLVSANAGNGQAVFVLQGLAAGTTEVWASVVPGGSKADSVVAGGVSQRVSITVEK